MGHAVYCNAYREKRTPRPAVVPGPWVARCNRPRAALATFVLVDICLRDEESELMNLRCA